MKHFLKIFLDTKLQYFSNRNRGNNFQFRENSIKNISSISNIAEILLSLDNSNKLNANFDRLIVENIIHIKVLEYRSKQYKQS